MKTKKKSKKRGFTLIELLIVIAIIAILSVVVVLTLNPAEMLKRSRDSNRLSDFSTMITSINLYLADVSSTSISLGTSTICYLQYAVSPPSTVYEFASSTSEATGTFSAYPDGLATTSSQTACGYWFSSASSTAVVGSSSRSIDGTGWIPINLSLISSGAPIGQWPADPAYSPGAACSSAPCNGSAGHFYSFISTSTNNAYKLAAKMESALYSQGGTGDVESTDGGIDPNMYEQGTNLTL